MILGDERWRERAGERSPFYGNVKAYAAALKKAARVLVQRGGPLRLAQYHFPAELTPTMVSRLELASALGRLERDDRLAYRAITHYELNGSRWPRNAQCCAALGCSMEDARRAAWRGWCRMAAWICQDEGCGD